MYISQLIKGSKEKFFFYKKKLLFAAFHQLIYQHVSKDYNICNNKYMHINFFVIRLIKLPDYFG